MEVAKCSKCGKVYRDSGSIALVKDLTKCRDYIPCPNLKCDGVMKLVEE